MLPPSKTSISYAADVIDVISTENIIAERILILLDI